MPKAARTFRPSSTTAANPATPTLTTTTTTTASTSRPRPYSYSPPASDDDDDTDHQLHSRPHRSRHDPSATKRVTVRKTPDQVRALNIAFQQLGARPSQSDRRRLALEIGLSERIVNTWFRDERSKRKKEGIAMARLQPPTTATAPLPTHSPLSPNTRELSPDDADNDNDTDIDPDDNLIHHHHPPLQPLQPLQPPLRKMENNSHSDVSVANPSNPLPGSHPSTHYHPSLYDYSPTHLYPDPARSFPHVSPPLAVRQLNGTRIRNVVRDPLHTHRALHRPSGAPPTSHLLSPAYPPSELSSVSEHDGERIFDALSHTHSPITNVDPSPVRSDLSLPATPLEQETQLPISLPPVGSLIHPPEGGWTSSWRWSFYGHTSSMRATLEPASWSPDSSDSEGALGLENINPVSIRVSDYDKYDKPFDAQVKRSPFATTQLNSSHSQTRYDIRPQ